MITEFFSCSCTYIGALLLAAIVFGKKPFLEWIAGGKCTSKARLDGKVVIITGANTGIGKETAKDLVARGARVILACRDLEKAKDAEAYISKFKSENASTEIKKLDLTCLESVREFADDVLKSEERIDILINNAGIMMVPYGKTKDGFELQFGVNHLAHFLLTNLLLERIKQSAPSRIINVSSLAHRHGKINFDDLGSECGYGPVAAYGQSKVANIIFTRELAKRLKGTNVTAYSLHPGAVATELGRNLQPIFKFFLDFASSLVFKTPEQGAQTSIYCAVTEGIEHMSGYYFSDCRPTKPTAYSRDDDVAKKLWDVSVKLVGLSEEK